MLYLASRSPRRHRLIHRLRRPFRIVPSRYRESIRRAQTPRANAIRNAAGKARRAVLPRNASGIVIGADTFLCFQGRIIGKPKTLSEAKRLLRSLSGRSHHVYTGLCLRDAQTGVERLSCEVSRVMFRRISPPTIDQILASVSPLDKAGGYAVQEDRGGLIAAIHGSRTNVIGLPMELLRRELRAFTSRRQRINLA